MSDGIDPYMQDYYRLGAIREGARLEQINNQIQREQVGKLAEIGAQRLSQYGPQGQEWAQRLLSDPRAAMAMAEQYGGMQAIEDRLALGQAAGTEAETRALYEHGKPEDVSAYRSDLTNQENASTNAANAVTNKRTLEEYQIPSLDIERDRVRVSELAVNATNAATNNPFARGITAVRGPRETEMRSYSEAADVAKQLVIIDRITRIGHPP